MDTNTQLQTIELLKAAKPLFEGNDGYITAAIGVTGAIGGALAAYFPNKWLVANQRELQRKSTAFQIYADLKSMLEIERHRKYIHALRETIEKFESGEYASASYSVEVPDERYEIYKANLPHLGLLPPTTQSKIVLIYQLVEAVVQDMKPGGLLNATQVGKEPFFGAYQLLLKAKETAELVMAEIEHLYPDVA